MIYTPQFEAAMQFTFQWEGTTLEAVKGDPGGATFAGIDQRDHPQIDVTKLTLADAKAIYHANEWKWCAGDLLPFEWATMLFDATVNPGRSAIRWAQQIIGETSDGIIGINTLAGLQSSGVRERALFCDRCEQYYKSLVQEHPMMSRFLRGWLNRNDARRKVSGTQSQMA